MVTVTMTIYVDSETFCWIVNALNGFGVVEQGDFSLREVSLKKRRKYPYEVQVPIQVVAQFVQKDKTAVDLYELMKLTKAEQAE